jgi:hypothetical protein
MDCGFVGGHGLQIRAIGLGMDCGFVGGHGLQIRAIGIIALNGL